MEEPAPDDRMKTTSEDDSFREISLCIEKIEELSTECKSLLSVIQDLERGNKETLTKFASRHRLKDDSDSGTVKGFEREETVSKELLSEYREVQDSQQEKTTHSQLDMNSDKPTHDRPDHWENVERTEPGRIRKISKL